MVKNNYILRHTVEIEKEGEGKKGKEQMQKKLFGLLMKTHTKTGTRIVYC